MREPYQRLCDILEAIERIEKYSAQGKAAFEYDELIQIWILHYLAVIGEAGASLPDEFRSRLSGLAWKDIIGMRNILVHRYFDIDYEIVWSVVEKDLPSLKEQIQRILDELDD